MFIFNRFIKTFGFNLFCVFGLVFSAMSSFAQYVEHKGNDVTTPLHLLKPAYVTPYGETTLATIKASMDKVYTYLNTTTPFQLVDKTTRYCGFRFKER